MKNILSVILILLTNNARAEIIGDTVDPRIIPKSICHLSRGIKNTNEKNFFCSATLVESNKLISAAHCFTNYDDIYNYYIQCGNETLLMSEVITSNPYIDLSILKTKDSFVNIKPIDLADVDMHIRHQSLYIENQCMAVGYGRNNEDISGYLNGANIKYLSTTQEGFTTHANFETWNQVDNYIDNIIKENNLWGTPIGSYLWNQSTENFNMILDEKDQNLAIHFENKIAGYKSEIQKINNSKSELFLDKSTNIYYKIQNIYNKTNHSVLRPGDSGGAILCKDKGEWKLMGVNSYIDDPDSDNPFGYSIGLTGDALEFIQANWD